MNADLSTVLDAALKLPLAQREELIEKLSLGPTRRKEPGSLRKYFGMIDSGDPDSANNEKIDADLAAAYMDDHTDQN